MSRDLNVAEADEDQPCVFSRQELRACLRAPFRLADMVLGQRRRLAMNVGQEHRLPTLALVLAAATAGFALPFGAVLGPGFWWRVAALLLGAVAVCGPALHVLAVHRGVRFTRMQTLCVSLAASATAAVFTFAFAPILAFARLTSSHGQAVGAHALVLLLLPLSVFAGIGQLLRFLRQGTALVPLGLSLAPALFVWLPLFLFVNVRLAGVLGLL
jgi:hypothetical protein